MCANGTPSMGLGRFSSSDIVVSPPLWIGGIACAEMEEQTRISPVATYARMFFSYETIDFSRIDVIMWKHWQIEMSSVSTPLA